MSEDNEIPLENLSDRELLILSVQMLKIHSGTLKSHGSKIASHDRDISYAKGLLGISAVFAVVARFLKGN